MVPELTKGSRGGIEITGRGRPGYVVITRERRITLPIRPQFKRTRCKETGIDQRRQTLNSGFFNRNDERRCGGSSLGEVEPLRVGRDQKADNSDTENIEPGLLVRE